MSFQAYLDKIEEKTGHTPRVLVEQAKAKGYDAKDVKAGVMCDWLKADYDLGRGHAMALVHVIKNGTTISDKHVGEQRHAQRSVEHPLAGWQGDQPAPVS